MDSVRRPGRGNVAAWRGRWFTLVFLGLTSLLVLSAWCTGVAEPVPPSQAGTAASQFVSRELARGANYLRAVGAVPYTRIVGTATPLLDPTGESTLGYVYEVDPVGYVVITTDTHLTPVIAFSYESNFSWDEDPNNVLLHMLRQDLSLRMAAADAGALVPEAAASNESDWGRLLSPPAPPQADGASSPEPPGNGTTVYGPWITTYWDQDSPYNDDCPIDPVTSDRCVVGCTATALAQILNYWQYPTSVDFDDPVPGGADYTTDTRSIFIDAGTANFTGIDYNDCNPSDAVAAALSFAAGVSVEMDYTSTGSSAHMAHWPAALAGNWSPWSPPDEHWGYASADLRTYAGDYSWWGSPYYTTEASFYTQLSTSMTQGRPAGVWVSVSGGGGGHTIVADGWQSGGRVFHLNYGWTYHANGWYTMPTGMPSYGFVEASVVNIYPTATNYTLTTEVTGSGTVSNLPSGTSHSEGTHVLVTATPSAGSVFDHWEGNVSGTTNPLRVIMDGNKTVRAVFQTATTHWSDDMESGQNWTATGLWHMTEQKSHSSTHSQWYGQEGTGNYDTGGRSTGTLTSPAIDVSGTDTATISFWHWRSVFYYDKPGYAQDRTYAEYSLDGGGWTQFWYEDSEDPSQYTWQQVLYDVTTTGVSSMQVRFGFDTVYSNYYDDYPGWFIDDFGVYSGASGTAAVFRVTSDGTVLSDATVHAGTFATGSADVAEWIPVSESVEPGDVVELDPFNPGSYRLCREPHSARVAGVIATEPGMVLGEFEAGGARRACLALIGIVPVKVTDEGGPILPGDLLVTSSTPGYAMRWSGEGPCALVGKALEPMTGSEGVILVLLTAH